MGRCKFKLVLVFQVARAPMPHMVNFVQDLDDPNVQHELLTNLGPLGIEKEEEPDTNRLPLKDRSWAMMQPRLDEEGDEFRSGTACPSSTRPGHPARSSSERSKRKSPTRRWPRSFKSGGANKDSCGVWKNVLDQTGSNTTCSTTAMTIFATCP